MHELNYKGLNCPQPVINTKNFLVENPDTESISIIVDNKAASLNVQKFLGLQNFDTNIFEENECFRINATKKKNDEVCSCDAMIIKNKNEKNTLLMIASDIMGAGSSELGQKLMINFIKTLNEMGDALWRIVLVNGGVKLAGKDTMTVNALRELEKQGVSILVCGTCLEFYGITDNNGAGEVTNMLDIVTSMEVAEKVINF
jgi:selenium metabolism protein YedF